MKLGDVRGAALATSLCLARQLRILKLSHNQLSTKTAAALTKFPCLQSLDLSWNQFGGSVLEHLLLIVCMRTSTLLDLNLAGNSIGTWSSVPQREKGILALCKLVKECTTLLHLDIGRNMLNEEAGEVVVDFFGKGPLLLFFSSSSFFFLTNTQRCSSSACNVEESHTVRNSL